MAATFALGVRACCVAVSLLLGSARAAEPVSPLVGQTRDQLLSRYGEPKSQMETGNRVVYYYSREKIVLRNNVVVEVEELAGEPPAPAPSAPPTTAPGTSKESPTSGPRSAAPAQSTPPPEPKFGIKLVRPPSAKDGRTAPPEPVKTIPVVPAPIVSSESETTSTQPVSSAPILPATKPPEEPAAPESQVVQTSSRSSNANNVFELETDSEAKKAAGAKKAADAKKTDELEAKKKQDEAARTARRRAEQAAVAEPAESVISGRTYLLALIILVGGVVLLVWRYRQRQLELAASSVENTPLTTAPSAPVFTGNGFTAEVLSKLEWKQFEELVVAYYNKTGVVAVRTKTGPESPVHIKISWKGEPRPFAYVQCIPHPAGLIDPKPLHALVAALAGDDIRRGYVVTSGKFNVPARDFAEEKHLTLLPGDIFLEKLNALPATARAEIMQTVSAADVPNSKIA